MCWSKQGLFHWNVLIKTMSFPLKYVDQNKVFSIEMCWSKQGLIPLKCVDENKVFSIEMCWWKCWWKQGLFHWNVLMKTRSFPLKCVDENKVFSTEMCWWKQGLFHWNVLMKTRSFPLKCVDQSKVFSIEMCWSKQGLFHWNVLIGVRNPTESLPGDRHGVGGWESGKWGVPGFELGQTDQRHRVLGLAPPVCPFTSVRAPSTCQARRYFVCPHLGVYSASARLLFFQLSEPGLPARYDGHSFNGPDLCVCHFTLPCNLSIPVRLPFCTWLVAFLYLAGCLSVTGRLPFYMSDCLSVPGRLPFYTCQLAFLLLVALCQVAFYTCLVAFLNLSGCLSTCQVAFVHLPGYLSVPAIYRLLSFLLWWLFIDLVFNFRTQITDSFFFTCISCIWEPQTKNRVPTARKRKPLCNFPPSLLRLRYIRLKFGMLHLLPGPFLISVRTIDSTSSCSKPLEAYEMPHVING